MLIISTTNSRLLNHIHVDSESNADHSLYSKTVFKKDWAESLPALVTIGAAPPHPVPAGAGQATAAGIVPQLALPAAFAHPLPLVANDAQLLLRRLHDRLLRFVLHKSPLLMSH